MASGSSRTSLIVRTSTQSTTFWRCSGSATTQPAPAGCSHPTGKTDSGSGKTTNVETITTSLTKKEIVLIDSQIKKRP